MRKKLVYLLLFVFTISLTACTSVSSYIKTQRSQYLHSENLPPLKAPVGLQIQRDEMYIIPEASAARPTQLPDLQSPMD
jgi:uncharacterized lipoprotein